MYMISACLMGENCKYNGGNNETAWVLEFAKTHDCVFVCPEAGMLTTPRPPSEIIDGRAFNKEGVEVTDALRRGAENAWQKAESAAKKAGQEIEGAILKANSPSCGSGTIYDGTFSGRKIPGDGFFAQLLKAKGVRVFSEEDKESLI